MWEEQFNGIQFNSDITLVTKEAELPERKKMLLTLVTSELD